MMLCQIIDKQTKAIQKLVGRTSLNKNIKSEIKEIQYFVYEKFSHNTRLEIARKKAKRLEDENKDLKSRLAKAELSLKVIRNSFHKKHSKL